MDNNIQPSSKPPSGGNTTAWVVGVVIVIVVIVGAVYFMRKGNPSSSTDSSTEYQNQSSLPDSGQNTDSSDNNNLNMSATGSDATASSSPNQATSSPSQTGEKTFTVEGGNYYFTPSQITVNKGDKVKIIFKNSGGHHDFVIDEFKVATDRIDDGQTATVEFTADKSGAFQYYCSVGNHRSMGMQGTLTVK